MSKKHDRIIFVQDTDQKSIIKSRKRSGLFLDRDGVIIKDIHYIKDPKNVILEKGALKLIKHANKLGWLIIIITNQSGISRGYFGWEEYYLVTKKIISLLGTPNPISAIYANGLGPDASLDSWRKPSPKMINFAAEDLYIDLSKSILIGDRLSDIKSGYNAGVKTLIHTQSGHGKKERLAVIKEFESKVLKLNSSNNPDIFYIRNLDDFPYFLLEEE